MRSLHDELLERLDELSLSPGLTAAADQHAAAVRDIIQGSGLPLTEKTLRDYRHGFLEVCMEKGWWPGQEFDWELLRATAIERELRTVAS
ncbi:DUF6401 family natural product biosynthesis protein [Actinocorallia longicatena]|uniref:Uncharacterized protein n=1 Tax=Actinocorallia longicatena TaxID=111803 RepID=A0ABP6Q6B9_9ACTN